MLRNKKHIKVCFIQTKHLSLPFIYMIIQILTLKKRQKMKKILFLITALAVTTLTFGQRVEKGEKQINAGVGFSTGGWGMPVYAGLVGGIVSYVQKTYNYGRNYKNTGRWFGLGAKGDYHFNTLLNIPNEWDVYAGLTLAYNHFSYSDDWGDGYGDYNSSGIGFGVQIGGRYYFSDNLGINLELGGASIASGGKVGISFKF